MFSNMGFKTGFSLGSDWVNRHGAANKWFAEGHAWTMSELFLSLVVSQVAYIYNI